MKHAIAKVIFVFIVSLLFLPGMNGAGGLGLDASFFRARGKVLLKKVLAG